MRFAFLYDDVAFGAHRPPIDFADVEAYSLTGSDLAVVKYAAAMAERGHEVVIYVARVLSRSTPEGAEVRRLDCLEGDLGSESFGAAIALSSPNELRHFPASTLRIVNRQCARFGPDALEGWQGWTDLVTCPSDHAREHVGAGVFGAAGAPLAPLIVPLATLPNGCDPASYTAGVKVPGRVVYTSCPDRGLDVLLELWPDIKRQVPEASLRIFYYALPSFLAEWAAPGKKGREAARATYIRYALERLRGRGVEAVGGISHRELAREMSEAMVFGYPCDTGTYTETFSVATLEACAAGACPVVSSCDALGSVYEDAAAVIEHPVREHRAEFVRAVVNGLRVSGLREGQWRAAQEKKGREFAARHTWPKLAEQLEQLVLEHGARRCLGFAEVRGLVRTVLESRIVSPPGARVTETVTVLSESAAKRLETKGEIPAARPSRRAAGTPILHLALSSYASGDVEIDLEDPFYENEGGGCRAGFLGLVRAMGARGDYVVRAFSTFKPKQTGFRDGVDYRSVQHSSLAAGKPDVVLAYYDCRPLVGLPRSILRVASHHTFNLGPWAGALEWTDLNLAPCQYAVDSLRPVYDTIAPWHVLPNACVEPPRLARQVEGRVIFHTSPSRGLQDLLERWPEIRRRVPHATLHIVGGALKWCEALKGRTGRSAENAQRIMDALPAAKAAGGVELLGFLPRKELLRELAEAQCFAFPASTVMPSETFSISILECLKLGTPVVLAPCDALDSLWGRVVRTSSVRADVRYGDAFADAVVEVLTDENLRTRLAAQGMERAAKFTFEASASRLDAILRGCLFDRRKGRGVEAAVAAAQ
jgi:glycosyltransferase involved in cell wall biosynthesis